MSKRKLVVIGNGMAGVRAVEELLNLAPDLYEITIFGAEPHVNYNRILLSPVLCGEKSPADIILNDADWYAGHGITLHAGKRVTHVDRHQRIVRADDGTEAAYDRLLLATGKYQRGDLGMMPKEPVGGVRVLPPQFAHQEPPVYPHQLPYVANTALANHYPDVNKQPSNQDIKDGVNRPDDLLRFPLYGQDTYDYHSEFRAKYRGGVPSP